VILATREAQEEGSGQASPIPHPKKERSYVKNKKSKNGARLRCYRACLARTSTEFKPQKEEKKK
jgi:hypothetical protein